MADPHTSKTVHGKVSDPTGVPNSDPSFQRASFLFCGLARLLHRSKPFAGQSLKSMPLL